MRPYSESVKADVRRRMSPPNRQNVVEIAQELGIHSATLYKLRQAWRLQGEVVPASERKPRAGSSVPWRVVRAEGRYPDGSSK